MKDLKLNPPLTCLRWHTCTADDPWRPEIGRRCVHPDAIEGDQDDDWTTGISCQRFHCPHCGTRWKQEMAQ